LKKKEDSVEVGTDYEYYKGKDYLTQESKQLLNNKKKKKNCIQTFLQGLTPTEFTDY
jgi:hypothetical protein